MAYATTVLDEFTLDYEKSNIDFHENRKSTYGAYETFKRDTPKLIPGYNELIAERKLEARVVRVPVLQKGTVTTGSTRSCTAETTQGTSAYYTPSWTTVEAGFMMVPAEHQGNHISYQQAFNHQMYRVDKAFALDADTDTVAYLVANLSGVNDAEDNPWAVTADYMQVPLADHDVVFNELESVMFTNDIQGPFNVVGSPRVKSLVNYYTNQGAGNSANTVFQFGDYNFAYTNRATVSTAYHSALYAMAEGSLGYLSWVDADSRMGHKSGDGHEWYEQELPLLGHNVGVQFQSTCDDKSTLADGLEATLVESFNFSFDRSIFSSYDPSLGTTDPGAIYGLELLKT